MPFFSLCWTGFTVLALVSQRNPDPGAGLVESIQLAGGWWFMLASDVLVVVSMVFLWLASRAHPRDHDVLEGSAPPVLP